jgi:hypothetical protein
VGPNTSRVGVGTEHRTHSDFQMSQASYTDLPIEGVPDLRLSTRTRLIKRGIISVAQVIDAATEAERRQRSVSHGGRVRSRQEMESGRIEQMRRDDETVLAVSKLCCQGPDGQLPSQSQRSPPSQQAQPQLISTSVSWEHGGDTDVRGPLTSGRWFGLKFVDDTEYMTYVHECAHALADAVFNTSRIPPTGDGNNAGMPGPSTLQHSRGVVTARLRVRHKLPGEAGHQECVPVVYGNDVYEALRIACVDLALNLALKASGGLAAVAGLMFDLVSNTDVSPSGPDEVIACTATPGQRRSRGAIKRRRIDSDDDDGDDVMEHADVSTPTSPRPSVRQRVSRQGVHLLVDTETSERPADARRADGRTMFDGVAVVDLASPLTQGSVVELGVDDGDVGDKDNYAGDRDNYAGDRDNFAGSMPESFSQITSEAKQHLPEEMRRELRTRLPPHRNRPTRQQHHQPNQPNRQQYQPRGHRTAFGSALAENESVLLIHNVKLPLTLIGSLTQAQVDELHNVRRTLVNANMPRRRSRGGAKQSRAILGWAKRPGLNQRVCQGLNVSRGSELEGAIMALENQTRLCELIDTVLGRGAAEVPSNAAPNRSRAGSRAQPVAPREHQVVVPDMRRRDVQPGDFVVVRRPGPVARVERSVSISSDEQSDVAGNVNDNGPAPDATTASNESLKEPLKEPLDATFSALELGHALGAWMTKVGCPSRLEKSTRQGGPVLEFVAQLLAQDELVAAHLAMRVFSRMCCETDCTCRRGVRTHWAVFRDRVVCAVGDVLKAHGLAPFASL